MDVLAVGPEIENRVPDDLARAVIRDIAATPRLEHVYAQRREPLRSRNDVASCAPVPDADGEHVWVFEHDERVRNGSCPALLDQLTLQFQRFAVRHAAHTANLQRPRHT
jgi:hypothetical protein